MPLKSMASQSAPAAAFRRAGYDLERGDPEAIGASIRTSAIRVALVAGLDYMAQVAQGGEQRDRLTRAAKAADPDDWRDRFRRADRWNDAAHLQALARDVDVERQSPQLLAALAQRFRHTRLDPNALLHRVVGLVIAGELLALGQRGRQHRKMLARAIVMQRRGRFAGTDQRVGGHQVIVVDEEVQLRSVPPTAFAELLGGDVGAGQPLLHRLRGLLHHGT